MWIKINPGDIGYGGGCTEFLELILFVIVGVIVTAVAWVFFVPLIVLDWVTSNFTPEQLFLLKRLTPLVIGGLWLGYLAGFVPIYRNLFKSIHPKLTMSLLILYLFVGSVLVITLATVTGSLNPLQRALGAGFQFLCWSLVGLITMVSAYLKRIGKWLGI